MTPFLQRETEVEWKSPWRIEQERRRQEETSKKKLKSKAPRNLIRIEVAAEKPRPPAASNIKSSRAARCANKVLSDVAKNAARRVEPKRFCSGCQRPIRRNKTGKCQVCIYGRERCECGKTIYKHVDNPLNKCMACYRQSLRRPCAQCDKLLNASNKYGLCKEHYSKQRRTIHGSPRDKCASCEKPIRANTKYGKCRVCARTLHSQAWNEMRRQRKLAQMVIPPRTVMLESALQ